MGQPQHAFFKIIYALEYSHKHQWGHLTLTIVQIQKGTYIGSCSVRFCSC